MKKIVLAAVGAVTLLALGSSAFAADAVMATASEGGAYNKKICPAIAAHVAKAGINLTCQPSKGSGENFENVRAGKVVLALGQLDISGLKQMELQKQSGKEDESMGTVGFIVPEALFCVAKKGGRMPTANAWTVLNDSETPKQLFVISTYSAASGPSGTLNFLAANFANFKRNVEIRNLDNFKFDVELGRLRGGSRDLVCFMNMPNPDDERIQTAVAADDLFFVPFDSPMLATIQINGRPAYHIMDAPISGGMMSFITGGKTVRTIGTGATVYMNVDNIPDNLYKAVVAALRDDKLLASDDFLSKLSGWKKKALGVGGDAYNNLMGR